MLSKTKVIIAVIVLATIATTSMTRSIEPDEASNSDAIQEEKRYSVRELLNILIDKRDDTGKYKCTSCGCCWKYTVYVYRLTCHRDLGCDNY